MNQSYGMYKREMGEGRKKEARGLSMEQEFSNICNLNTESTQ